MTAHKAYRNTVFLSREAFPNEEKAIAADITYSYLYARDIIHGRWIPGEAVIVKNETYCKLYIKMVLRSDENSENDPGFMAFVLANS